LYKTPAAHEIRAIKKCDCIKLKNFCTEEEQINKVKIQSAE
jgi:hypothetical protein